MTSLSIPTPHASPPPGLRGTFWAVLFGLLSGSTAWCQSTAPAGEDRVPVKIVIVVPEEGEGKKGESIRGTCRVPYPRGYKDRKLAGHWDWEGDKAEPRPNPLRTADGRTVPFGNPTSPSAAHAILTFTRTPIQKDVGGDMTVEIGHPRALTPGVYQGRLDFSVQYAPESEVQAIVTPTLRKMRLEITVIKCGRWIRSVSLHRLEKDSPPVFGQPWEVDIEIDEFSETEKFSLDDRFALDVEVSLGAKGTSFALAKFGLDWNEDRISFRAPPGASPKHSSLWDGVLFDPQVWNPAPARGAVPVNVPTVAPAPSDSSTDPLLPPPGSTTPASEPPLPEGASDEKARAGNSQSGVEPLRDDLWIYNSRTSTTAQGPQSWDDPVLWRIDNGAPSQVETYALTSPEAALPARRSRRVRIGFPPLDLLGRLKGVCRTPTGQSVEGQAPVHPGFAGFPCVVVADSEPVVLAAAWPEDPSPPTALVFELRQVDSSEKTVLELAPADTPRGEGIRYLRIASVNGDPMNLPSISSLGTSGTWELRYVKANFSDVRPATSPPEGWDSPVRIQAALNSPDVEDLLVFADSKPWSFTALPNSLNLAYQSEQANGPFVLPDGGWKSAVAQMKFMPSQGLMTKQEVVCLDSVVRLNSTEAAQLYAPTGLPVFEVAPKGDGRFTNLDPSVSYDGIADFSQGQDPATLSAASFQEVRPSPLGSRRETFRVPFLFRFVGHDGETFARIVPKDVGVRIRSGGDYASEHLWEILIIVGLLACVLIFLGALILSRRHIGAPAPVPPDEKRPSFDEELFK